MKLVLHFYGTPTYNSIIHILADVLLSFNVHSLLEKLLVGTFVSMNKQVWSDFVQAFEKQFSSQKNVYCY